MYTFDLHTDAVEQRYTCGQACLVLSPSCLVAGFYLFLISVLGAVTELLGRMSAIQTLRKHTPLNHTFTRSPVLQKTVHTRSWPVKKAVLRKRARIVETDTKVPKRTPHFDSVHTAVLQFCNTLPSIVDSRPDAYQGPVL